MIQLTYEPALDPYHTVFRMLQIYDILEQAESLPVDHVRILDFYVAFPFRAETMRFKSEHRRLRQVAKDARIAKPYGEFPPDRLVMRRMEFAQQAALQTLAAKQVIQLEALEQGEVKCTPLGTDHALIAALGAEGRMEPGVTSLIRSLATEYELMGKGGLKERTGLLEHKYDAA